MIAKPGDVVVVQLSSWTGFLVRLGARIAGKPGHSNHVAIVTGDNEVIEAWPGGVRHNTLNQYLAMEWTLTNGDTVKNDDQRQEVVSLAKSFLKTPYDWEAIAKDTTNCLDINNSIVRDWIVSGSPPRSFVCSSLAAYVYDKVGLPAPHGGRFVEPADWAELIEDQMRQLTYSPGWGLGSFLKK